MIRVLRSWKVIDVASGRSSHRGVAIRGVGIATLGGVIAGILTGLMVVGVQGRPVLAVIGIGSLLGALLGLAEDVRGLPVGVRAGGQLLLGLTASVALGLLTSAPWWWVVPSVVFVAGYVNAANFMDGLNGMSGIHGAVSGLFFVALGLLTSREWLFVAGAVLAASFFAFLPWNLLRKGTFLGDSGSYLLGSMVSLTAVAAWMSGIHPLVAVGPAIIYCVDTGGTLLGRIVRGERWFEPHRSHVYQRLTLQGIGHVGSSSLVGLFTALVAGASLLFLLDDIRIQIGVVVLMATMCGGYWLLPNMHRRIRARRRHAHEGELVSK